MNKAITAARAGIARILDVRGEERVPLGWSFVMFFCVLASYFTVRPVREMMGASLPKGELAQLFTVVFLVMLELVQTWGPATRPRRALTDRRHHASNRERLRDR